MNEYRYNSVDHVHEILDGDTYKPLIGTSSMSGVLAKPGLVYWSAGLAVEKFGWTNKGNKTDGWAKKEDRLETALKRRIEVENLDDEQYLSLLDEAYSAHTKKLETSAELGTDMHAVMENYIKKCIAKNGGKPLDGKTEDTKLKVFVEWSLENVSRFIWSEVNCYSRTLWLGGISDCGFEDKQGRYAILDFKSSKAVYLSQYWQCVGYAMQLEENGGVDENGNKLFTLDKPIDYVVVLPFGMKKPKAKFYWDMVEGKECVKAMLLLHRKLNKNDRE